MESRSVTRQRSLVFFVHDGLATGKGRSFVRGSDELFADTRSTSHDRDEQYRKIPHFFCGRRLFRPGLVDVRRNK